MHGWEDKDIQYYNRPAMGYQVIILAPRDGHYSTLHTVIEYRYGSRYSYPARDEAEARKLAVQYAMRAITEHWDRMKTRMEARIYPFGGIIRDMRLIPRRRS
jgi:hypothetical protein